MVLIPKLIVRGGRVRVSVGACLCVLVAAGCEPNPDRTAGGGGAAEERSASEYVSMQAFEGVMPDSPALRIDFANYKKLSDEIVRTRCDSEDFRALADRVVQNVRADTTLPRSGRVLVSAAVLNNEQMHDCQRMADSTAALGPLVALLIDGDTVENGDFDAGVVVADVVDHDDTDYDPLGIRADTINCLWLKGPTAETTGWEAAMGRPLNGGCAAASRGDLADRVPLEVHRLPVEGPGSHRYPSTGRWMWDSVAMQQFIGIRCGDAWCEVGAPGFTGTQSIATDQDVPGRWDEQYLAYTPRGGGDLERSRLWGRVEPGRHVKSAEDSLPDGSAYGPVQVAIYTFDWRGPAVGDSAAAWNAYVDKFGLDPDSATAIHALHLRKQSGATTANPQYSVSGKQQVWTPVTRCNSAHSGTGTVRWSWSDTDEGIWVPCDKGCCRATTFQ